jgi:pilus assembly protein Flp/PilA
MLKRFLNDERGVTAIEYGLIAGLIFVVIVAGIGAVGGNVTALFDTVAGSMGSG